MTVKPCIACHQPKPLDEYYRHTRMADGHLNKCKDCVRAYSRSRWNMVKKQPERLSAERARGREKYQRLYAGTKRGGGPRAKAAWRRRNPLKVAAHNAVARALKAGKLRRPEQCEVCHRAARLHAHHEDHTKSLNVQWRCSACHGVRHRKDHP